jgi:hypothetical protein
MLYYAFRHPGPLTVKPKFQEIVEELSASPKASSRDRAAKTFLYWNRAFHGA